MYNRQPNLTICFLLLYMFLIQNLHIMLQMHYYIPSGFPETSPLRRLLPLRLPKMPYGYFACGLTQAVFEPHLFSTLPWSDQWKDLSGWFPYVRILPRAAPLHGHFSGKQIQIPDLRFARHKHLYSTRQKHFFVRRPQCTVICGIYLIIQILLSM